MWSGRQQPGQQLVSLKDVLAVPGDVRRAVSEALPASDFTLYGLSWHHAGAVTNPDAHPYEMYLPFSTARNMPCLAASMAGSRDAAQHARMTALLPHGADPGLPVCRDVWQMVRGTPRKQYLMDVVFPPGGNGEFPMRVNMFLFSPQDAEAGNFTRPARVQPGVTMTFVK